MFTPNFPAWENQHSGMAFENSGKCLGSFHPKIDPVIFHG